MEKIMDRPARLVIVRHAESERNKVKANNIYFPDEIARDLVRGTPDHKIKITPEGFCRLR